MKKERYFLFQDTMYKDPEEQWAWHPDAYFIIPSELGYNIFHQYGCTGCYHFEIKGFAVPVPDLMRAKLLEEALGCEYWNVEGIEKATGLEIESVLSEALAKLKNGWYVATCNCD